MKFESFLQDVPKGVVIPGLAEEGPARGAPIQDM